MFPARSERLCGAGAGAAARWAVLTSAGDLEDLTPTIGMADLAGVDGLLPRGKAVSIFRPRIAAEAVREVRRRRDGSGGGMGGKVLDAGRGASGFSGPVGEEMNVAAKKERRKGEGKGGWVWF